MPRRQEELELRGQLLLAVEAVAEVDAADTSRFGGTPASLSAGSSEPGLVVKRGPLTLYQNQGFKSKSKPPRGFPEGVQSAGLTSSPVRLGFDCASESKPLGIDPTGEPSPEKNKRSVDSRKKPPKKQGSQLLRIVHKLGR